MDFEITYYAEGHRNGSKVTLVDVCGHTFDTFTVSERRWYACNTPREEEALILGVVRREYPEVKWEHAHRVEIHQV